MSGEKKSEIFLIFLQALWNPLKDPPAGSLDPTFENHWLMEPYPKSHTLVIPLWLRHIDC